jgi:Protein of unknown function (DUF2911)
MRFRTMGVVALAVVIAGAFLAIVRAQQPRKSPHETVKATIDGADISIEYGRPYMKGRKVEGGLIPYDSVWRTGADEATTLTSDKALTIGGTMVPAGKHTLWTAASSGEWKLVINNQTGQWGTDYDEKQDLARVPLTKKTLSAPVEQFTIAIEPKAGGGGVVKLTWNVTEASVPFTVNK